MGSWVPAAPGLPQLSWHLAAAALKEYSCEFDSMKYYALCSFGSILSCGLTDTTVVPPNLGKFQNASKPSNIHGHIEWIPCYTEERWCLWFG